MSRRAERTFMAYPNIVTVLLLIISGIGTGFLIANFRPDLAIIMGLADLATLLALVKPPADNIDASVNRKQQPLVGKPK
jgi:hypothetical protein